MKTTAMKTPAAKTRTGTIEQNLLQANARHRYIVRSEDLPLSCPMPDMSLWNSHPRVFLPLTDGKATCPYCGAEYFLQP